MYAVTPAVEEAWRQLILHVAKEAEVDLTYLPYPAPQPLEELWARPDLGCAFMCGYPISLRLADVIPIVSPIPAVAWAGGIAAYRSDLIVRADSIFHSIEDVFGHRAGWTVEHSHSGFNAFRHHLLFYRDVRKPTLFSSVTGNLITARRVLDAVSNKTIEVGPLDAYWHHLLRHQKPELFANIRVIASTALAPMPALVAGPNMDARHIARLRERFIAASTRPWFPSLAAMLQIQGFAPVDHATFAPTLHWRDEAIAAGYPYPA